ncbi:myotubularin-related protein 10-B [Cephus cinctus]|uniref:Myotubularin-related protein 10-B n=1 Tax=Cephus cinctus TaxID=211228 RepID=A0AAJ7RMS3_CEPCN|nr:myotubularin-related protein 10-B [Cephus cinctus]XP_024943810.1 myotubularin-related protein 10-B [Cephus cinctus]
MDSKSCNNFVSYVGFEEHEMQPLGSSRRNSSCENGIKLLPGELLIAKAQNVLMFSPVGDSKQGMSGVLSVTNFKLAFVTTDDTNGEDATHQQNHLYGYTDTCLTNVDAIYVIAGDKKRRLLPGNPVPSKVKGIFIICKNMRTWLFSFKFSPLKDGKNLLTALLHHAFPNSHHRLFAYDYKEPYYSSVDKGVQLFRDISDWQNELDRTMRNRGQMKKGWRISSINVQFKLSDSLPQYVIVPASITDSQLNNAAQHFQGSRPPIWSWSNERGAALVRMSELHPTITERTQENTMFENIRKSHPQILAPIVIELNKDISVKSVAAGYSKFVSLCSPENIRQFWLQDNNFYSLLESTRWLKYISYSLEKAVEASEHLNLGTSVILQESDGRDMCCVVSSLVQLLLDPHFRTITGFQSLLQKEWIAAGHPFCDRLGLVVKADTEKSPLFLLYLDCVWQLCQQFPAEFEFTETYLTTVWDAAHVSIFDTFIFNCEKDRARAVIDPNYPLVLRSVWDWREQFNDQDILLFYNPLYNPETSCTTVKPLYAIPCLELWTQCYFRWIPPLEIRNGGRNHIELYTRLIQNDISRLKVNANGSCASPVDKITTYLLQMNIDSFYPFSNRNSDNTTISTPIMNSSMLVTESLLDAQSLLNAPD